MKKINQAMDEQFQTTKVQNARRSNRLYDAKILLESDISLEWKEAVELFLQARRTETESWSTVKLEEASLTYYARCMMEQKIEASIYHLTAEHFRNHFVQHMINKKYALNTINCRIKSIRRFFTFLNSEGWIEGNPTAGLKTRHGHRPTIHSLSKDQVVLLLDQPIKTIFTGFRDYAMMYLLLDTGLRVGELVRLKLSQVDMKQGYLQQVIGKGRKPRDIPFCNEVRKVLQKYLKARGELADETLFVTLDGSYMHVRTFQENLKEYGRKAGIENVRVSPHTLRHTFAKLYILNGGDPYSLQDILGHSSQDMVKNYLNLWQPEKKLQHTKASPIRNLLR